MAKTPLAAAGHHVHSPWMYVRAAVVLSLLMALTIGASYVNFGNVWINNLVAIAIAITKTSVIVMYFMNVKYSTSLTKLFAALGFIWVTLIWVIVVDYFFRGYEPVPSWSGVQETALPRRIGSTDNTPLPAIDQNVQNRIPRMLGN
ncbi:hypothetical protein EON81_20005 [bacterium]|nr:MAG: hypothetical protein EON81_20005 [bacterium]